MLHTAQDLTPSAEDLGTPLGDELFADWAIREPIELLLQEMSPQHETATNGLAA